MCNHAQRGSSVKCQINPISEIGPNPPSLFLGSNESHIYPNMYVKFGCDPTVGSKKGEVGPTDKRTLQL